MLPPHLRTTAPELECVADRGDGRELKERSRHVGKMGKWSEKVPRTSGMLRRSRWGQPHTHRTGDVVWAANPSSVKVNAMQNSE